MNTTPRLFRDTATDSAGGLGSLLGPVGLALGAAQTGIGLLQGLGAKKRMRDLLRQRKAFSTPEEIFKILEATEQQAQSGYSSETLNYLNNQTDQAFSASLSAAQRLGGDPNAVSAIFGQKIDSIRRISAEDSERQMANFSKYLQSLNLVAENKGAEWASREGILKDKMQAEGLNMQAGTGNVSGGINTLLSTLSSEAIGDLYNPDGTKKRKTAWSSDGMGFNSSGIATGVF